MLFTRFLVEHEEAREKQRRSEAAAALSELAVESRCCGGSTSPIPSSSVPSIVGDGVVLDGGVEIEGVNDMIRIRPEVGGVASLISDVGKDLMAKMYDTSSNNNKPLSNLLAQLMNPWDLSPSVVPSSDMMGIPPSLESVSAFSAVKPSHCDVLKDQLKRLNIDLPTLSRRSPYYTEVPEEDTTATVNCCAIDSKSNDDDDINVDDLMALFSDSGNKIMADACVPDVSDISNLIKIGNSISNKLNILMSQCCSNYNQSKLILLQHQIQIAKTIESILTLLQLLHKTVTRFTQIDCITALIVLQLLSKIPYFLIDWPSAIQIISQHLQQDEAQEHSPLMFLFDRLITSSALAFSPHGFSSSSALPPRIATFLRSHLSILLRNIASKSQTECLSRICNPKYWCLHISDYVGSQDKQDQKSKESVAQPATPRVATSQAMQVDSALRCFLDLPPETKSISACDAFVRLWIIQKFICQLLRIVNTIETTSTLLSSVFISNIVNFKTGIHDVIALTFRTLLKISHMTTAETLNFTEDNSSPFDETDYLIQRVIVDQYKAYFFDKSSPLCRMEKTQWPLLFFFGGFCALKTLLRESWDSKLREYGTQLPDDKELMVLSSMRLFVCINTLEDDFLLDLIVTACGRSIGTAVCKLYVRPKILYLVNYHYYKNSPVTSNSNDGSHAGSSSSTVEVLNDFESQFEEYSNVWLAACSMDAEISKSMGLISAPNETDHIWSVLSRSNSFRDSFIGLLNSLIRLKSQWNLLHIRSSSYMHSDFDIGLSIPVFFHPDACLTRSASDGGADYQLRAPTISLIALWSLCDTSLIKREMAASPQLNDFIYVSEANVCQSTSNLTQSIFNTDNWLLQELVRDDLLGQERDRFLISKRIVISESVLSEVLRRIDFLESQSAAEVLAKALFWGTTQEIVDNIRAIWNELDCPVRQCDISVPLFNSLTMLETAIQDFGVSSPLVYSTGSMSCVANPRQNMVDVWINWMQHILPDLLRSIIDCSSDATMFDMIHNSSVYCFFKSFSAKARPLAGSEVLHDCLNMLMKSVRKTLSSRQHLSSEQSHRVAAFLCGIADVIESFHSSDRLLRKHQNSEGSVNGLRDLSLLLLLDPSSDSVACDILSLVKESCDVVESQWSSSFGDLNVKELTHPVLRAVYILRQSMSNIERDSSVQSVFTSSQKRAFETASHHHDTLYNLFKTLGIRVLVVSTCVEVVALRFNLISVT